MNRLSRYNQDPLARNHEAGISLDGAIDIATLAHKDQRDKGGDPYITHPLRVMRAVAPYGLKYQVSGVLHDVVEDTWLTLEYLRQLGINGSVLGMVEALTKRPGEDYDSAIARVRANNDALIVKIADNRDNSNERRLARLPSDQGQYFREKYDRALAQLLDGNDWAVEFAVDIEARIDELVIQDLAGVSS